MANYPARGISPWDAVLKAYLDEREVIRAAEQSATYVPVLAPISTYTYDGSGNVLTETVGGVATTYTYNSDGTPNTATRGGVTRTFVYSGGNMTGVA